MRMKIAYKDWSYFPDYPANHVRHFSRTGGGAHDPPPLGYGSIYYPFTSRCSSIAKWLTYVWRWWAGGHCGNWKRMPCSRTLTCVSSQGQTLPGHRVPPKLPTGGVFKPRQQRNTLFSIKLILPHIRQQKDHFLKWLVRAARVRCMRHPEANSLPRTMEQKGKAPLCKRR